VPDQIPDFDLYRDLEIDPAASFETIEAAWRSLVRRNHPDTAADEAAATERIKRLNVAHDWLSDAEKRSAYDGTRRAALIHRPAKESGTARAASSERRRDGWLARTAAAQRERGTIRAVLIRAQLLSATEVQRLVAAREARIQGWDDAFDAVEGWKKLRVSQSRSAREADRRRAAMEALGDEAFGAGYWTAKAGRAWALADDAGMAVKETVEALLARPLLSAVQFDAYFGAWAEVIGLPNPRYFLGPPLARLAWQSFKWFLRGARRWFARRSLRVQLFVVGVAILLLLRFLPG
jgi:hypothetical protein